MTERQEYIKFIKEVYPIGCAIKVINRSEPYIVTKRTVFRAFPWKAEDYNDHFRPEHDKDYRVDFSCHNPGRDTRDYPLRGFRKEQILEKYRK